MSYRDPTTGRFVAGNPPRATLRVIGAATAYKPRPWWARLLAWLGFA